jgi:hypothetical protein
MRRKQHNLRRDKRMKRLLEEGDVEAKTAENTPIIAADAGLPLPNSASVSAPVTRAPSPKVQPSATVPPRESQKSLLGVRFIAIDAKLHMTPVFVCWCGLLFCCSRPGFEDRLRLDYCTTQVGQLLSQLSHLHPRNRRKSRRCSGSKGPRHRNCRPNPWH